MTPTTNGQMMTMTWSLPTSNSTPRLLVATASSSFSRRWTKMRKMYHLSTPLHLFHFTYHQQEWKAKQKKGVVRPARLTSIEEVPEWMLKDPAEVRAKEEAEAERGRYVTPFILAPTATTHLHSFLTQTSHLGGSDSDQMLIMMMGSLRISLYASWRRGYQLKTIAKPEPSASKGT